MSVFARNAIPAMMEFIADEMAKEYLDSLGLDNTVKLANSQNAAEYTDSAYVSVKFSHRELLSINNGADPTPTHDRIFQALEQLRNKVDFAKIEESVDGKRIGTTVRCDLNSNSILIYFYSYCLKSCLKP